MTSGGYTMEEAAALQTFTGQAITKERFDQIIAELRAAGFADKDIEWSENVTEPADAEDFASEAIFVICNSGMKNTIARRIYEKVMSHVRGGRSAFGGLKHPGKATAIDSIWNHREGLLAEYRAAPDKVEYCASLPWIGGITKYHLAKNFGAQVAKPDVHLQRLADLHDCTAQALCERLAAESGFKVATVDVLLWRACAEGILDGRTGEIRSRAP